MLFNAIIAVWIAAGIVVAFAMPPAQQLEATPIAFFHVPAAVAMLVAFLVAAWYGARWLKTRDRRNDALSLAFAEVGAVLGIIATITGAIWAKLNWNSYWNWDPQQVGIVAVLLTYGALFALRSATEDEEKSRNLWAVYGIFGAISAIFWTYIFRRLMPSLHPDDVVKNSDPLFSFALRFNIIGYLLVTVRLAQLRARLEGALQRVKDRQWA